VPLSLVPVTQLQARAFVLRHHRHNVPPPGARFCVGVAQADELVGVALVGRPVARALDDGLTVEVTRVCTVGTRNAASMLYAASWRAAKALGFLRCVTYTRADESGASLRAAGFVRVQELPARRDWLGHSVARAVQEYAQRHLFDSDEPRRSTGGVARVRWEVRALPSPTRQEGAGAPAATGRRG
jgi:hypothetical protein